MKWLFLLLLAANLAVYFWTNETPTEGEPGTDANPPAMDTDPDTPTILLIEEAREQKLYPLPEQMAVPTTGADVSTPAAEATPPPPKPKPTPKPAPKPPKPAPASPTPSPVAPASPPAPAPSSQPRQAAQASSNSGSTDPIVTPAAPTPSADEPPSLPEQASATTLTDSASEASTDSAETPPLSSAEAAAAGAAAAAATATASGDPATSDTPPTAPQCFRLGPFETLAEATMAQQDTMELGFSGRLLQATRGKVSYQILLGPYEDPDERLQTMNELFDAGVGDILIGEDNHLNALVAGRFPSRAAAAEKLNQLEQLGYKPRLSRQSLPEKRFYLDLNTPDGSGSRPAAELLEQEFPDTGVKPGSCPSTSRN